LAGIPKHSPKFKETQPKKRLYIIIVVTNENLSKPTLRNLLKKLKDDSNESKLFSSLEQACIKGLLFYNMLVSHKYRELSFFTGSYEKVLKDFSFTYRVNPEIRHLSNSTSFKDLYPSCILDCRLYHGDEKQATCMDKIKFLKITHVINVTEHVPNNFEKLGVKYLKLAVEDKEGNSLLEHFKEAFEFIDSALFPELKEFKDKKDKEEKDKEEHPNEKDKDKENLKKPIITYPDLKHYKQPIKRKSTFDIPNNYSLFNFVVSTIPADVEAESLAEELEVIEEKMKDAKNDFYLLNEFIQTKFRLLQLRSGNGSNQNRVLVHCSLGASRSSTIVIMYLMKKFKMSFDEILEYVKFQRRKADPISVFQIELSDFEKKYEFSFKNGKA